MSMLNTKICEYFKIKIYQPALLFILFFIIGIRSSQAQFLRVLKSIDEVEIIAGPSLVSFRAVGDSQFNKIKVGYTAGLAINWHLKNRLGISAKLLYEKKGINRHYQVEYFDESTQQFKMGDIKEAWNFNYLSLPITLKYALNRKKNLFIEAGSYIAYLQKAQAITKNLYNGTQSTTSQISLFEPFDLGITSALSYSASLQENLFINVRMFGTYGLIDISHYGSNTDFQVVRTESCGLMLSLIKKLKKTNY